MTASTASESHIEPIHWPAPVRRITVHWDGKAWAVVQEVRVERMTLPAPDVLPDGDKSRGFWVESIDEQGRVRYREVMADPLAGMEQFGEGGRITRLPHAPHEVTIELLVPDLAGLAELHLVSNSRAAEQHGGESGPKRSVLRLLSKTGEPGGAPAPPPPGGHDH